jgi:hypothetical protein
MILLALDNRLKRGNFVHFPSESFKTCPKHAHAQCGMTYHASYWFVTTKHASVWPRANALNYIPITCIHFILNHILFLVVIVFIWGF